MFRSLIIFFCLFTTMMLFQEAHAQHHSEFIPSISISEQYDDNIYLEPTDEISDYITLVSLGLTFTDMTEKSELSVGYTPTFVWYKKESENNTVRHAADIGYRRELTQHLEFEFTDAYYRSEDPIERTLDVEGVRRTRQTYQRNTGEAALTYTFGPENEVTVGYAQSDLINDEETLHDGRIQTPFAGMTYWFNTQNGMELSYEFVRAEFWREEGTAGDDYYGNNTGVRYIHRWSPHTSGYVGYEGSSREFDDDTEDYYVHQGIAGWDHAFSRDLSFSLGAGYFVQDNDRSDNETGYVYNASLTKSFENGSIMVEGAGGWDEAYLEAERRGFTRFWSVGSRFEYQVLELLVVYLEGRYRMDEDDADREWETFGGSTGLTWDFYRWASLSLDYTYAEREHDVFAESYKVNRVTATITFSRPFSWMWH